MMTWVSLALIGAGLPVCVYCGWLFTRIRFIRMIRGINAFLESDLSAAGVRTPSKSAALNSPVSSRTQSEVCSCAPHKLLLSHRVLLLSTDPCGLFPQATVQRCFHCGDCSALASI